MRAFVRELLALRRASPVLRQRAFFEGRAVPGADGCKDLAWFRPDGAEMDTGDWFDQANGTVGMYLDGRGLRHRGPRGEVVLDQSYLLVLHAGEQDCAFVLPAEPWAVSYQVVIDTSYEQGAPAGLAPYPAGLDLPVTARSVVLLRTRR
jgi:glycogen operon protein